MQNPEALSTMISEEDHDDLWPLIHGSKTYLMQSIRTNGLVPGGITHHAGRAAVHFMAYGLILRTLAIQQCPAPEGTQIITSFWTSRNS